MNSRWPRCWWIGRQPWECPKMGWCWWCNGKHWWWPMMANDKWWWQMQWLTTSWKRLMAVVFLLKHRRERSTMSIANVLPSYCVGFQNRRLLCVQPLGLLIAGCKWELQFWVKVWVVWMLGQLGTLATCGWYAQLKERTCRGFCGCTQKSNAGYEILHLK